MTTESLLEIDSDQLFEKHTISEIKIIQGKIQNEIEKKKEELRIMVGEKCRDLLKAADIIIEMQDTSKNIINVINQTNYLCQSLQEKRLLGFRQPVNKTTTTFTKNSEEISKIIEIKILLILPEQIWTALDNKDYFLGAQLFLFATHLHLGLEISSNSQNFFNKYSVINKQWAIINNCKQIIIDGACNELKILNIPLQKATECLCCLILLESTTYEKLLNQFLDLRLASLNDILKSEELSKKKLRQTVETLQHTLMIVYHCFFDKSSQKCSIEVLLNTILSNQSKPTLFKIIQKSSWPEQYLSPMITNYRPNTSENLVSLQQEHIKKVLDFWLENVEKILSVELNKILLLVDNIKRLHKIIKEEIFDVKYPDNWDEITLSLLGISNLNIYNKFIKSYMTNRMKELIQSAWLNGLNYVLDNLKKVDEVMSKDKNKQENDIRWFVWKENKGNFEEGLKLKTMGYTPKVMELCEKMNHFLIQLLEDVELYVNENSKIKHKIKEVDNDSILILNFLNSHSFEMIQKFTHYVKDGCKTLGNESIDSKIIIRARFLSSLTNECPGLEKCLKSSISKEDFNENVSNNLWQKGRGLLNETSTEIWHDWKVLKSSRLKTLIKSKLGPTVSLRSLLKSKLLSEIITIEEQTEDGSSVKSDLRISSQPSLSLQELLFQICRQVNAIAPHTLPKQVHQELIDCMVKDILEHYQEWTKSETIYQTQAWQMLMDVKFLTLMFVTNNNKDLSQEICEILEKSIDPFDLDVHYSYLQNNVKKSVLKLQGTFGILVNISEKLPVFNGLRLSQSSSGVKLEEPNLLAMSTTVPWFPLLPVAKRSNSSRSDGLQESPSYSFKELSADKQPMARHKDRENKKESVTSDFFKSAGAFFDAMTGGGWSREN
ncbi:conserved hypothetical protein [Pediculus humanus corporis]|uniref:Conserved oligomeric Golgi complex subunit 1 n=1 Tax=Pediculus humanus subsp. corporis TaxID=121224 RepID=E0VS87_PEDHC|nr:uncharacterized protein Phum_PHUM413450 [Pediculus humanus corporis]EEB16243.1 conserved hypothetical protein [Pediculus humanus corporis]